MDRKINLKFSALIFNYHHVYYIISMDHILNIHPFKNSFSIEEKQNGLY